MSAPGGDALIAQTTAHWFGPKSPLGVSGEGHPVMFGFAPARDFDPFPEGGGYPKGFLERAYELIHATDPDAVLHLCSGSVQRGIRLDVRAEKRPTVIGDARVAMIRKPLRMVGVWGITTGSGYAIRAFTVCEKPHQMPLLLVPASASPDGGDA